MRWPWFRSAAGSSGSTNLRASARPESHCAREERFDIKNTVLERVQIAGGDYLLEESCTICLDRSLAIHFPNCRCPSVRGEDYAAMLRGCRRDVRCDRPRLPNPSTEAPDCATKTWLSRPSLLKISSEDNYILISRLVAVSAMLRRQWSERFPGPSGVFPNSFPLGW